MREHITLCISHHWTKLKINCCQEKCVTRSQGSTTVFRLCWELRPNWLRVTVCTSIQPRFTLWIEPFQTTQFEVNRDIKRLNISNKMLFIYSKFIAEEKLDLKANLPAGAIIGVNEFFSSVSDFINPLSTEFIIQSGLVSFTAWISAAIISRVLDISKN